MPKIHFVMLQIPENSISGITHSVIIYHPNKLFSFSLLLEYGVLAVTCINEDMRENFTFREFSIQHKETEDVR